MVFCLLALDGEAVSACILFNVFPIEEMFPTIACFMLPIIVVDELLDFLVFSVFSAALVVSMSFIVAVIFVLFGGHGQINRTEKLHSSPHNLTSRR